MEPQRRVLEEVQTGGVGVPRSTRAGGGTPATASTRSRLTDDRDHRSTRAGGGTPATGGRLGPEPCRPSGRSTRAGGGTPATGLVGGVEAVAAAPRSTRAGGGTPATAGSADPTRDGSRPLNEGWGWNPSDGVTAAGGPARLICSLNEGWGWNPSDGRLPPRPRGPGGVRSTRAGGGTPATAGCMHVGWSGARAAQRGLGVEPQRRSTAMAENA